MFAAANVQIIRGQFYSLLKVSFKFVNYSCTVFGYILFLVIYETLPTSTE